MAHFHEPVPGEIEAALAGLIRSQLALAGVDPDDATLNRIRQQLPVAEWLDTIREAGRRERREPATTVVTVAAPAAADDAVVMPCASSQPDPAEAPGDNGAATDAGTIDSADATPTEPAAPPATETGSEPAGAPDAPAAAAPAKSELTTHMYRLLVPNATADTAYAHRLDLAREPLSSFRIAAIHGLDAIGLAFDPETGLLDGIPRTQPGQAIQHELEVALEAREGSTASAEARLSLFVNPHPRSLWKQVEPEASLPFRKEHRRSLSEAGTPSVLVASVRGRSHENSGAFREDDFQVGRNPAGTWTVVAVSDGAGSAPLSRLGSQLATQASVASLLEALDRTTEAIDAVLTQACEGIDPAEQAGRIEDAGRELLLEPVGRAAFDASRAIKAKSIELEVEEKALAATLMFAATRRIGDHILVASYWIGDGAAALLDPSDGRFHLLGEADSGEYSGQTRFLLSSEFQPTTVWESIRKRFRFHCVPASTVLLLMTDGVSDPKFGTDNALRDPARWLSFWNEDLTAQLALAQPGPEPSARLEEYLQFWSQGEHDDRTLALVTWP